MVLSQRVTERDPKTKEITRRELRTKKSTEAQVIRTSHAILLKTEVNRAAAGGTDGKPVVIPVGKPVPRGPHVWMKGMAVWAMVGGRRALGIITGLKSRGTVVIRAKGRSVEASPRRLKRISYVRSVLLMPATRAWDY